MAFDALELWRDLVTAYSQCRFTRPEDKLYAFSGIAKLFQEAKAAIPISGAFLVLGIGRWAF
ncbi:hypothetical protein CGCA056_v013615 [Colletotrichum aenigma]|uniref:uncharacterized protein n=1 Tax=Colletotrichum aenigma TaxID=1215731 RepID=UPI0018732C5E|nr:uncharacterized protein CGCA056_v013615 [Colletotrichum aenigma]KAF5507759.1 hypothetical protein CGCA056_v013615 [Colletotrichum aenigma]